MNWLGAFLFWLWGIITFVPRKLGTLQGGRKPRLYRTVKVEDFPDKFIPETLYLAGEEGSLWGAALLCPCGCGERIEINLLKQARPCWTVHMSSNGVVSLTPSIWRQRGCGSHFFLRNGRIEWCPNL